MLTEIQIVWTTDEVRLPEDPLARQEADVFQNVKASSRIELSENISNVQDDLKVLDKTMKGAQFFVRNR